VASVGMAMPAATAAAATAASVMVLLRMGGALPILGGGARGPPAPDTPELTPGPPPSTDGRRLSFTPVQRRADRERQVTSSAGHACEGAGPADRPRPRLRTATKESSWPSTTTSTTGSGPPGG